MDGSLSFADRVVVVTGGGRGLGRQYALLFAKRGASVIVNDLGGNMKGDEESTSAADVVVREIKAAGGKAVANYDPVQNGDKIIKTAIDHFGRIDVVVNNAGILRDKSFLKMTDQDWDLIQQVHLLGAFKVTRAAWPYMREQKYGRIIMTSSGAGVFGNFGQANYSAAKMGLIGLSNTLAVEGQKYGIHCNVIIPVAASRLTESILPPDLFDKLKPEYVAPVVAWLCHEDCQDNGEVVQAAGGWVGKYNLQRSKGVAFPADGKMTIEAVREYWGRISDLSETDKPNSIQEDLAAISQALNDPVDLNDHQQNSDPDDDGGNGFNIERARKTTFKSVKFQYQSRDTILYALGVGCNAKDDLKFLYEGHNEFSVLPTFAIVPSQAAILESGLLLGGIPGIPVDLARVLHGEQFVEVLQPLPTNGVFKSQMRISDVVDKGSGAVLVVDIDTYDSNDSKIAKNQTTLFLVGSGGFGGKRNSEAIVPTVDPPKRAPDAIVKTKTFADQPAMYRLSGDLNPLHIDADFAALGGFSKPILHGLCSLGIVVRQVLQKFASNDVAKFKTVKVRFNKPVYPGETLETHMWVEKNRVIIESKVAENGNVVIKGGFVDLTNPIAVAELKPPVSVPTSQGLKSDEVFSEIKKRVSSLPDLVKQVKGVFQWNILKNGKEVQTWVVDLKNPPGDVYMGSPKTKADVTLSLEDDIMAELVSGKLNPQKAFMTKKLTIKGNIMLTQKLQKIFQSNAKL